MLLFPAAAGFVTVPRQSVSGRTLGNGPRACKRTGGIRAERFLMIESHKTPLTILLASPRGFCAGVDRAIQIVERAIERYGRPVYVRHEIVHNRCVVEGLEAKGAIFVEELDEGAGRPSRGVLGARRAEGGAGGGRTPQPHLHRRHLPAGLQGPSRSRAAPRVAGNTVVLIGHAGHPEVIGTMGQLPAGAVQLVKDVVEAEALDVPDPHNLAYATQTTLSGRRHASRSWPPFARRFPAIEGPKMEDIC